MRRLLLACGLMIGSCLLLVACSSGCGCDPTPDCCGGCGGGAIAAPQGPVGGSCGGTGA